MSRPGIEHLHRAIANKNSEGLKLILPQVEIRDQQVSGLLQRCIEQDRRDHARRIINRYQTGLTPAVMEFLGMREKLESDGNLARLNR
jgi:hypothetical protein